MLKESCISAENTLLGFKKKKSFTLVLKDEIGRCSQLLQEKNALVEKSESEIQQKGAEMLRLTENLTRSEVALCYSGGAAPMIQGLQKQFAD